MTRALAVAAAIVLGLATAATSVDAQCDEQLAAASAKSLRENLSHEAGRLHSWRVSWTMIFAGGAIGQVALGGLVKQEDRPTFDVGAVKAALGAATTPFLSPRFSVPAPIEGETACEDLARLRAALAYAGKRQAKGVAWYQHFPGVAVNVAGILYLGLVHDLWVESLLGAAFGTLVGELKLLTQPRRAIDWAKGRGPNPDSPWISRVSPVVGVGADWGSIGLSFQF